ncbi:hypothetical protein NSS85_07490 [Paenibacillus sp. FSL R7-0331]|uniref:hypothetical protein n=1 Tax=Paenibacillus sp. FSL R7-0331 TaxID=1536773 RepID=UPI0026BC2301
MNIGKFSYYGYSWLALVGLQLAIRTDRLERLVMGGFPPLDGPYKEMLIVTNKTYQQASSNQNTYVAAEQVPIDPEQVDWDNIQVQIDPNQTKQFVTMYEHLRRFDDRAIQQLLELPRLAFAGEKDTIVYGENFGQNKAALEQLGWDVEIIMGSGMDHTKAMQPATVLPLLKPWLIRNLILLIAD